MDSRRTAVVFFNPKLPNQDLYCNHLNAGLSGLGYSVWMNDFDCVFDDAEFYVCIGPHWALDHCLKCGKPTIYIDRCLWGDDLEYVTIGWLNEDGGMKYPLNAPGDRPKPDLLPWKHNDESKAIYLMDYGPYDDEYKLAAQNYSVQLRPHPATGKNNPPLIDHLGLNGVAMGRRTSALATAAINGYPVISFDKRSPVYEIAGHDILDIRRPDRTQWLNNMSYAQWSGEEIATGEALKYALDHSPYS